MRTAPPGVPTPARLVAPSRLVAPARAAAAVGLLALVLFVLGAPSAAQAGDVETITSYDSQIVLNADGSMRTTETIAYDFGGNAKHGIFRFVPVRFHYDDTHDRLYPLSDVHVTVDGAPAKVAQSTQGADVELKIGDPNRILTGPHTYVITYTVKGAVNAFPDHDELYWNVIGTQWPVSIQQATSTVTTPADITKLACFAGPEHSQLGCDTSTSTANTAHFSQANLSAGSGLSVVVALPPGTIANPGPILAERWSLARAFAPHWYTIGGALLLAVLGVGGALLAGYLIGRDRRYLGGLPGLVPEPGELAVEARKPLTGAPPVSVEFTPPYEIRPGQVGTLIDEQANVIDVTATILDFAVRRHLKITELPLATKGPKHRDWELQKLTNGDPKFLPYERTLFDALFHGAESVRLSGLKYTFSTHLARVRGQLYTDMIRQGWYRQSPRTTRAIGYTLGVIVLCISLIIEVVLAAFTHLGLVGLGLVAGAIALLAVAGKFPARAGRGSAMLARVEGFRLYVATAETEQIKFQEREEIFSRYLPYAMVFGLVDRWAGIFKDIGSTTPGGSNGLYWYTGSPGWSMFYFAESIGSFNTVTTGTIATTPASSPSASGGSGFDFGGGFSGGGGGGGGGGSW